MRDKLKGEEYFQNFIEKEYSTIDYFYKGVEGRILEPDGQETFDIIIDMHLRDILIAKYSMGVNLETLIEDFLISITAFEKVWNPKSMYVQMLWMLSIGILLEVGDEVFDRLVALEEKDSTNDYLVDYLIAYRKPGREISENVKWPTPYKFAKEVTQLPKAEAEKHLKLYLEKKWYKGHNDSGWYDTHKEEEALYSGYWSFESGAIVKIMGLDDSSFKDNQYYPYDMVHYRG